MITRIEIDGFKTFQSFQVELEPLQVIVGANGCGKSNLFDALLLLSHLVTTDIHSAFANVRGAEHELFTLLPDGTLVDRMKLAVELLLDRSIQDLWGKQSELQHTRMRYELELARQCDDHGREQLFLLAEQLIPIPVNNDSWLQRIQQQQSDMWLQSARSIRTHPFISTHAEDEHLTLQLHPDGKSAQPLQKTASKGEIKQTMLSIVPGNDFPHANATREALRRVAPLHLNPEVIGEPDSFLGSSLLTAEGRNLTRMLAHMQAEDPGLITDVSRDLAYLVPGMINVHIAEVTGRHTLQVQTEDGRVFAPHLLSDGVKRLLALIALKNNPDHAGTLCMEEPENGIHPSYLKKIVWLLCHLATDFSDVSQSDQPLRQLLINTHSPVLISQPAIYPHIIFAHMATLVQPGNDVAPMRVTRMTPLLLDQQTKQQHESERAEEIYTLQQVLRYLDSADVHEARLSIEKRIAQ